MHTKTIPRLHNIPIDLLHKKGNEINDKSVVTSGFLISTSNNGKQKLASGPIGLRRPGTTT